MTSQGRVCTKASQRATVKNVVVVCPRQTAPSTRPSVAESRIRQTFAHSNTSFRSIRKNEHGPDCRTWRWLASLESTVARGWAKECRRKRETATGGKNGSKPQKRLGKSKREKQQQLGEERVKKNRKERGGIKFKWHPYLPMCQGVEEEGVYLPNLTHRRTQISGQL